MNKSRDRDKKFALACGLGVLAVAGLIVLSWDGLRAWYVGYSFIWLPEGALPMHRGHLINASGEVALKLDEDVRAGLWSMATREVLPLDVPLAESDAPLLFAINDAGDLIGTLSMNTPRWWGSRVSFFWKKDAGVTDFSTVGDEQLFATAINDRGQVVGHSNLPHKYVTRAFLWSAESGIAYLGALAPGKNSEAHAINEAGWVVGSATLADRSDHPFLWKPETGMQDLGLPPGFSGGDAAHINDQGEVLMNVYSYTRDLLAPVVWREKDGLVKLPTPPGFDFVVGAALNNQGTVLLEARTGDPSLKSIGYLIVNGVLMDLPGAPLGNFTEYYGLNDKGWLVGTAFGNKGDSGRGFVALPVR